MQREDVRCLEKRIEGVHEVENPAHRQAACPDADPMRRLFLMKPRASSNDMHADMTRANYA